MTRFRVVLRLPLVLAMLAAAATAHARVTVDVTGIDGDPRDNVMAMLSIAHAPGRSDETEVRRLHASADEEIRRALEPYGFYAPIVHSSLEGKEGRWAARYAIAPGPRMPVEHVDVTLAGEGANDPGLIRARQAFQLAEGEPLDHAQWERHKKALAEAAAAGGFLDARFDTAAILVDRERYVANLVVRYDSGPRYRFGDVTFEQDVVDPDLLKGYVNFGPGDPADVRKLLGLQDALGQSPYWKRVEVEPRRDLARGGLLPIVVDLIPAKRIRFSAGVGYGTDGGAEVRSRTEWRRVNRRGHRASIEGVLSQVERSGSLEYAVPWPYPRTDVVTFTTGFERIESDVRTSRTVLGKTSHTRLWGGWRSLLGFTYRRENFEVGPDTGTTRFLTADASWSRTRADDRINPRHGARLSVGGRGAHDAVLSDATFAQLEGDGKWVEAIRRGDHRVLVRTKAAATFGDATELLPPSLRYFAGGAYSVRGYAWESIGPRDEAGHVVGGRHLLIGSVELERRLFHDFGVAVFWDSGNALASWRHAFDELEHGTGIGIRWVSPLGRVRGDFAWPVGGDHILFHLAVGPDL